MIEREIIYNPTYLLFFLRSYFRRNFECNENTLNRQVQKYAVFFVFFKLTLQKDELQQNIDKDRWSVKFPRSIVTDSVYGRKRASLENYGTLTMVLSRFMPISPEMEPTYRLVDRFHL